MVDYAGWSFNADGTHAAALQRGNEPLVNLHPREGLSQEGAEAMQTGRLAVAVTLIRSAAAEREEHQEQTQRRQLAALEWAESRRDVEASTKREAK